MKTSASNIESFAQIPNVVLRANINLTTYKALMHCYSNADAFRYSVPYFIDYLNLGKRQVQRIIKTLIDAGVFTKTTPQTLQHGGSIPNYLFVRSAVVANLNKLIISDGASPDDAATPDDATTCDASNGASSGASSQHTKNTIKKNKKEEDKELNMNNDLSTNKAKIESTSVNLTKVQSQPQVQQTSSVKADPFNGFFDDLQRKDSKLNAVIASKATASKRVINDDYIPFSTSKALTQPVEHKKTEADLFEEFAKNQGVEVNSRTNDMFSSNSSGV